MCIFRTKRISAYWQRRWWDWWWRGWWRSRLRFWSGYLKKDEGLNESDRNLCFNLMSLIDLPDAPHFPKCTFNDPIILVYNRNVRVAASTSKRGTGCGFLWMFFKGAPISHCHIRPHLYFTSISAFFSCCLLLSPFSLLWQHVIYAIWDTLNYIFFHLFTNMLNYLLQFKLF